VYNLKNPGRGDGPRDFQDAVINITVREFEEENKEEGT
jgi:hypothetical protein